MDSLKTDTQTDKAIAIDHSEFHYQHPSELKPGMTVLLMTESNEKFLDKILEVTLVKTKGIYNVKMKISGDIELNNDMYLQVNKLTDNFSTLSSSTFVRVYDNGKLVKVLFASSLENANYLKINNQKVYPQLEYEIVQEQVQRRIVN